MTISSDHVAPELSALIAAVRLQMKWGPKPQEIPDVSIDWGLLFQYMRGHRLHVFLERPSVEAVTGPMPLSWAEPWDRAHEKRQLAVMKRIGEIVEITGSLANRGVRSLSLKGEILGRDLYGAFGRRHSGDIDLWVSLEDLPIVDTHLRDLGFTCQEAVFNRSKTYQKLICRYLPHLSYLRGRTNLEVHWSPFSAKALFPLDFETAWARSRQQNIGGHTLHVLEPADNFLYLSAHAAAHFYVRLFWLLDVAVAWEQSDAATRTHIFQRSDELKQARSLCYGLNLAQDVFGPPSLMEDPILADKLRIDGGTRLLLDSSFLAYANLPPGPGERITTDSPFQAIRREMALHPGCRYKWQVLFRHGLRMDEFSRWPLPRLLWWIYPFIRLGAWIWRKLKGGARPAA